MNRSETVTVSSLYEWRIQPSMPVSVMDALAVYPRILQRLLYNRGIRTQAEANIYLQQSGSLYDPFLYGGLKEAVKIIFSEIDEGNPIVVYGDYDVDGVTATTILVQVLRKLGAKVKGYIPNRFEEGYGLNKEALKSLYSEGTKLIITVDCGIRSPAETQYGKELGMKMIISDHHDPAEKIPDADAVICAKKPGDLYPDKNLAGAGIAYKIAEALLSSRPVAGAEAEDWIDLATLGTVADIVPLTGENRSLVKRGLQKLQTSSRPAIIALSEIGGFHLSDFSASTIGYSIGPRLNAAGRLETATLSLNLLLSQDLASARVLASQLDDQNKQRQVLTRDIEEKVSGKIKTRYGQEIPTLIADCDPAFNMGVVGLAASKLTEAYYRPAIVGAKGDESTRASCRSIPEFHITNALNECADLLERFGGHAMAAGFTVKNENWDKLIDRLKDITQERLGSVKLQPTRTADMEITLDYLDESLLTMIQELEPNGQMAPEPVFLVRNLRPVSVRPVGNDQKHLKLNFSSDSQREMSGIAFRQGFWAGNLPQKVDILCNFEKNTYQGRDSLQLNVLDIRPSSE